MPTPSSDLVFIPIIAALLSLGCLLAAFHFYRRRCLIDDTPTSKAKGVFIGTVELKGTAESETPLRSYLAGVDCVHYSYKIEEHWRRTSLDAKGRPKTQSGWKTVAQKSKSVPIYLKDDTGLIRILPDRAEIHADSVFSQECRRNDSLYYEKGPAESVTNSTHRRRFTEQAIPLHNPIYLVGHARERHDLVAAEIAQNKNSPWFLISTHDEKHHSNRYRLWYWLWLAGGLGLLLGGIALYQSQIQTPTAPTISLLTGTILYLAVLMIGWIWNAYNNLVSLRQRVNQGWSQIDIELKRRHDLIPNLIKTVEGYQRHESSLQQLTAEIRQQGDNPGELEHKGLQGINSKLLLIIEEYPELKADQSFLALQQCLAETEQRLAMARDYYNEIATFYRTRLEIIPDRWLGKLTGFRPSPLLENTDFERAEVTVKLAD